MGAYSPAPIINKPLEKKIIEKIVEPTLKALKKINSFIMVLYVGLMIIKNEPYLIEYNIRMGDPECQVILPRLKTDLVKIIRATSENKLKNIKISWKKTKSMTIVLCSKGYPNKYKKNIKIKKIDNLKLSKNEYIFHAGTKILNNQIVSNGGRVLNVTVLGGSFKKIRKKILSILNKINWKQGFYRKDIGWKVISKKMRIISGIFKGRKIDYLKNHTTRPQDSVKESIFNILIHSDAINVKLDRSNVLDLYSGVGSFGIECISRGAQNVTFIEKDKIAYYTLKENLQNLSVINKTKVFNDDIEEIIKEN